jgi:hypothetical protein
MSPVELLQAAAAEVARSKPPWLISALAEPLAAWLEREALVAQSCFDAFPESDRAWRIADYAETYLGESLAVARVLLGVPDGR